MFNWNINLNARQVLMLMAFNATEPDEHGSQFKAAHDMITDAWSVRGARILCEDGLLLATHDGIRSCWTITPKGRLIAEAISLDAKSLSDIKTRLGADMRHAINITAKQ